MEPRAFFILCKSSANWVPYLTLFTYLSVHFFIWTGTLIAQIGTELTAKLKVTLNLRFSCLCLQSARIISMYHHTWFMRCWGEGTWDVVQAGQARYQWNPIPAAGLSSISDLPLLAHKETQVCLGKKNELTLPIGSNWKPHCLMIISLLVGTAFHFSRCSLRCT